MYHGRITDPDAGHLKRVHRNTILASGHHRLLIPDSKSVKTGFRIQMASKTLDS